MALGHLQRLFEISPVALLLARAAANIYIENNAYHIPEYTPSHYSVTLKNTCVWVPAIMIQAFW